MRTRLGALNVAIGSLTAIAYLILILVHGHGFAWAVPALVAAVLYALVRGLYPPESTRRRNRNRRRDRS